MWCVHWHQETSELHLKPNRIHSLRRSELTNQRAPYLHDGSGRGQKLHLVFLTSALSSPSPSLQQWSKFPVSILPPPPHLTYCLTNTHTHTHTAPSPLLHDGLGLAPAVTVCDCNLRLTCWGYMASSGYLHNARGGGVSENKGGGWDRWKRERERERGRPAAGRDRGVDVVWFNGPKKRGCL